MRARDDTTVVVGYVAGRFDSRVIAPIAGLVLAAMLTLAAVVWWTAAQSDAIALRNEARLLSTALAARLGAEAEMLYDYAFWDEAYEKAHLAPDPAWAVDNVGGWAHERLGVAMTLILDPEGRPWFAMVDGVRDDRPSLDLLGEAGRRHVQAVQRQAPDRPRAAFLMVGSRAAVVTAAPIGTHTDKAERRPGPPSAMVQVTFLDQENLAELARTYLLPGLRLDLGPAGADRGGWSTAADPETMPFPLRGPGGEPIGTLTWRSSAPGADLLAHVLPALGLATLGLAVLTLIVLRQARASAAAIAASENRATHDPLTGLPNRRLLQDRLATALARLPREGGRVALLYLDLDGFKAVNDRLGDAAGDQLLCEIAGRLTACAREADTVARLGGDEFVVLQVGGDQPEGAVRLARAILKAVRRPVTVEGGAATVGISIGIALAPDHATDQRGLAGRADAALYAAKSSGRGAYKIFDPAGTDPDGIPDDASPPSDIPARAGALLATDEP